MTFKSWSLLSTSALLTLLPLAARAQTAAPTYKITQTWPLPGEGGWDYLTLNAPAHRLFIARGDRIQVVNTQSGKLVGEVPGLVGAHGVALDTKDNLGFASSGRTNTVIAFDLTTLKAVGEPIKVGQKPDFILFEPKTARVWAFDAGEEGEGANSVSIIDPATKRVVQIVGLGSNPEAAVSDGQGGVWVNLEGSSELAHLDARTGKVLDRHSLAPGEGPTGLALDAKSGRLFSGCSNKTLVISDAVSGKVVGSAPIGEGVDAARFDAQRSVALASCGRDGVLSVVRATDDETDVSNVPTHFGARTMELDPATGDVYVVAADYEKAEPAPAGNKPKRPKIVPNSVRVLKLAPVTTK